MGIYYNDDGSIDTQRMEQDRIKERMEADRRAAMEADQNEGFGFTGFNPGQAMQDINNFCDMSEKAINQFKLASEHLFDMELGLYYTWCSPNAIKFYDKTSDDLKKLFADMCAQLEGKYRSLARGYNIIASRNGIDSQILVDSVDFCSNSLNLNRLLSAHPKNGHVGINAFLVNQIMETFDQEMTQAWDYINSIPSKIAFFDDQNSQANTFVTNLRDLKNNISTQTLKICNDILNAINTEVNDDQIAKQQVVTTFNA